MIFGCKFVFVKIYYMCCFIDLKWMGFEIVMFKLINFIICGELKYIDKKFMVLSLNDRKMVLVR